ncbi:unnamed protein product [Durusdinium trenchii]|uniref:Uncharacterized protein n=1 Tax=Durusdinium trenchii TaxID=1381693 RepID=A0ABP0SLZ9_9DINO
MTAGVVVFRPEAEGKILEKDPRWDLEVLAAAAHWALRLMRKSLLSWSHLISKRRRSRLHGRCFREEEIVPRACRRTLERWKLAAIGQVHGRLVGSARKGRIFHAWRQGVRRSCSIRLMARQCGLRQCGIVLAAWSRAAAYCSKCRRILSLQRCQLMVKTCGKALAAWRLRSSALQALRRAAARRNHAQEEGALGAWRQLCSERLWRRTRLEMRAEHATMYRTFCDWAWQVAAELSLRLRLADRTRRCQLRSLMEWKGQMVLLQSRRLQAAEAIMSRNAEKKRLAWQYWKRLQFERRHVRRRRSDEWPRLLRWSFRSWHHGLLVSTFLLRRDELSSAGRCRLRRAWTAWTSCRYQVVHRTQSAEKHLCEDAFDAWRFGASPEMCEASMDLLEISASTEEVSKDTQAPDDVNRTLSDFSGLSLGASPIAIFDSPEITKTDAEISLQAHKLKELRKVVKTFEEVSFSKRPEGLGHRLQSPSAFPSSSQHETPQISTAFMPPKEGLNDAGSLDLNDTGAMLQASASEVFYAWLGACLQRRHRTLAVEEALSVKRTLRHLRSWQQLRQVFMDHRRCNRFILLRCWQRWQLLPRMSAARALSLCFGAWRSCTQEVKAERQRCKSFTRSIRRQLFRAWHLHSCRGKVRAQFLRYQHGLLLRVCSAWQLHFHQRRRAAVLCSQRMRREAAKTWFAWQECRASEHLFVDKIARMLQPLIVRLSSLHHRRQQRLALRAWRLGLVQAKVERSKQIKDCLSLWRLGIRNGKATFAKRAAFRAWAAAIQALRRSKLALGAWRVLLLTSKRSNRSRLQMVLNSWAYVRDVRSFGLSGMAQIAAMHRSAQCCEKSLVGAPGPCPADHYDQVMSAELAGRLVAHVLGGRELLRLDFLEQLARALHVRLLGPHRSSAVVRRTDGGWDMARSCEKVLLVRVDATVGWRCAAARQRSQPGEPSEGARDLMEGGVRIDLIRESMAARAGTGLFNETHLVSSSGRQPGTIGGSILADETAQAEAKVKGLEENTTSVPLEQRSESDGEDRPSEWILPLLRGRRVGATGPEMVHFPEELKVAGQVFTSAYVERDFRCWDG